MFTTRGPLLAGRFFYASSQPPEYKDFRTFRNMTATTIEARSICNQTAI